MKENFSKWNKRITSWLLLIVGFYMGLKTALLESGEVVQAYDDSRVLIFLGAGLTAIGLSIWHSIKGHPPGDDDDDD